MLFRQYSKSALVLVLFATLFLAGCVAEKTPSVYAVVDGEEISREDFNEYLNFILFLNPEIEITREMEAKILNDMIAERVYLAEADRRGFELDSEKVKSDYENFRSQIIAQDLCAGSVTMFYTRLQELGLTETWIINLLEQYHLINKMIDAEQEKASLPDDEAIEAYYEEQKDKVFAHGERRHIRHILVNAENFPDAEEGEVASLTKELAQDLYARLKAGEDFVALAAEYSQDTSATAGGDIGYVEQSEVVKEFGTVAFAAEPSVVSEPVESEYGWHILEVIEIQEPGYYELDEMVRDWISQTLYKQDKEKLVNTLLTNLLEQAEIKNNLE
jgi:hypothetical protein